MPPESVPISQVVFLCEFCLETFSTGTDLLDHKYEDHNIDSSSEEDEFPFFNQKLYEVGAEKRKITQPEPRFTRTRAPTEKPPPSTADYSKSSASEVNAAVTSSNAPTPAPPPEASTQISEGVFMCEFCLETFSTGTDLLDHKFEDHNIDYSREEDEFSFFNQSSYEVGAERRKMTQPEPRFTRTRAPTDKPLPLTADSSKPSASEVNAALTSSIAPAPAPAPSPEPAPALTNGYELESHLPPQPDLVKVPSLKPKMSYSCELCHLIYKTKQGLRGHQQRKHHCITNPSKKSSSNDNVTSNNIAKRKLRNNGDLKMRSKISEKRDVRSREMKVTSTKTKVDEPQVRAAPAKSSTFQTSSKRETTLDLNSKSKQLFPCKICAKIFSRNDTRYRHEKVVHHGDNTRECLQCSIPFTPMAFSLHKKECDSKFNSTQSSQFNAPFEPETEPQPEPSLTPGISTQVSLGAANTNIDDDSETDYESADDSDITNLTESASIPIPTRPPVVLVSDSGSETDFEFEFDSNYASQSQNFSIIGKSGDNFETASKNSSIIPKDSNDKNGSATETDSRGASEKIRCAFCFKEASSIEARIAHEAGHVREQLFECNICRLHFVSALGLESHKKKRHVSKM